MYALKITVNDQPPVIAGAEDLRSVSLFLFCYSEAFTAQRPIAAFETIVSGRTSRTAGAANETLGWQIPPLEMGGVVTVEIIETAQATPWSSAKPDTAAQERAHFEHCKQTYLALKDKFASE